MNSPIPRCQIIPLPDEQVAIHIDGKERTRWHFGTKYERPFFYPINGPSGNSLVRMGHPGAPNHDHHRGAWFAHHKVLGMSFWTNETPTRIQQKQWLCYQDGNEEAIIAVRLHWLDGHDPAELITQDVITAIRPGENGEMFLDVQSTFTPNSDSIEFGKTNFGFFAVRVAASISKAFGGGLLTNSEGLEHEKPMFGKPARYVDYSGPITNEQNEGITYFDHPSNRGFPNRWHVRNDGWMGCSICMDEAITTTKKDPLKLRFLLHIHSGIFNKANAEKVAKSFSEHPGYELIERPKSHIHWGVKIKE